MRFDSLTRGRLFMLPLLISVSLFLVSPLHAQQESGNQNTEKLREKISSLKSTISEQQQTIQDLRSMLTNQEQRITDLENEKITRPVHPTVKRLRESVNHLEEKNKELQEELSESQDSSKKTSEISDRVEELESDVSRLREKISTKNQKLKSMRNKRDQLQSKINQKDSELRQYRQVSERRERQLREMESQLQEVKQAETEREGQKLTITLDDAILFELGQAELKESASSTLETFIDVADSYPSYRLLVEGHTDDVPLSDSGNFQSNWELSAMRAVNVVQYIQNNSEIQSERLVAAGYGPHQPIVPNNSPKNRALNRRVEISLIPMKMMGDEVAPDTGQNNG